MPNLQLIFLAALVTSFVGASPSERPTGTHSLEDNERINKIEQLHFLTSIHWGRGVWLRTSCYPPTERGKVAD